jgi:cytochrome c biogenesis protein CcmG/thiol:disulfide interchange protein DsbE
MIIGISVDREGSDGVLKFYKKYGMNYPVVMAKPSIIKDYGGITAIPTSFLVDVNGKIIKTLVGSRSFNDYEAEILPYLPR